MLILDSISLLSSLVAGQLAANFALEIVERDVARLELLVELLLRVGRLHFGQLGVHIFVGGGEVQLGGALLQDFVFDHLVAGCSGERCRPVQGSAPADCRRGWPGNTSPDPTRMNLFAIHGGHHIGRGCAMAAGQ